jgi:hypothetical protein
MPSNHPYAELSQLQGRMRPGMPLPFNVRDADRTLLLARGQVVASEEQLEALVRRGALVDLNEPSCPSCGRAV